MTCIKKKCASTRDLKRLLQLWEADFERIRETKHILTEIHPGKFFKIALHLSVDRF